MIKKKKKENFIIPFSNSIRCSEMFSEKAFKEAKYFNFLLKKN